MPPSFVEKVTAFVTRTGISGLQMLLFQHPTAGVQFPAGTVEESEEAAHAVLREVAEETGLTDVRLVAYIGWREELPPGFDRVIARQTPVYARPDDASFTWAAFRRGIAVHLLRQEGNFVQVSYEEGDQYPHPHYTSYQITGWVPAETVALANRRHFFHLTFQGQSPDTWRVTADHHRFKLFWANLDALPEVIAPQRAWLHYITNDLGYHFSDTETT